MESDSFSNSLSNDETTDFSLAESSSSDANSRGRKHLFLKFQDRKQCTLGLCNVKELYCERSKTCINNNSPTEFILKPATPIEPPLEFQDRPTNRKLDVFCDSLANEILSKAVSDYQKQEMKRCGQLCRRQKHYNTEFISFSPCHSARPNSRSSLVSRLSSSHNSLSVPNAHRLDDSNFITQAVSHDMLSSKHISDLYNVPFDSDMYAVPVDVVKPLLKPKRTQQNKTKKRRNTSSGIREMDARQCRTSIGRRSAAKSEKYPWCLKRNNSIIKRHSLACASTPMEGEPIHMTLQEVRHYLQTLYSNSSDSSDNYKETIANRKPKQPLIIPRENSIEYAMKTNNRESRIPITNRTKKNTFLINIKNKKVKDSSENLGKPITISANSKEDNNNKKKIPKSASTKLLSFKQALCNMFRFTRFLSTEHLQSKNDFNNGCGGLKEEHGNLSSRALPPLPSKGDEHEGNNDREKNLDFATSIQEVKDYGWYWGPLPSEMAEKILSNEPDGSFIVRDSSDDHYIFSLTFKLNNCVRHVRIDHDQGNFSFGNCTKFKSQTIVEFIENAVEHSRSGRYLFFLHRRPVIGPVRVQLLHPVSRFKQVQSLQHICRFVINKVVRCDLIPSLPLPRRMIDYLNTPHYYSEHLNDDIGNEHQPPPRVLTPAIRRDIEDNNNPPPILVPLNNYIVLNDRQL